MKGKQVHYTDVKNEAVQEKGAEGVKMRWLINKEDGAPHFAMRLFEIEKDGYTPWHTHEWEHEVFILQGEGKLVSDEGEKGFKEGDVIYIAPMEKHQFKNGGEATLKFLCMVPHKS